MMLLVALTIGSIVAAGRFRNLARRNADLVETTESALATALQAEADAKAAKLDAESARDVEQRLREKAQRQTQIATDALADAEHERQRADTNRSLAEERELLARRNLYAAHMNLGRDAWENADISRAKTFLERHVPALGEPDWRSFEWYYLAGLCNADQLTIPCRHSWSRPEFSPDSTLVAVSSYRRNIELWDVQHSKLIRVIKDDSANGPVAFSPDGNTLASTGNGELKLWDVATGDLIRGMPGHSHRMLSVAFTPDGSRLISTDGGDLDSKNIPGIIRVWNPATGELIHEIKGHTAYIYNIAVSPDGRKLVSTGRDEILCWDLLTGEPLDLKIKGGHYGSSVSWSPDGDKIATFRSETVFIWDSTTGQQISSFPVPKGALRYSPDGRSLVMGHVDGTVRVWEIESGKQLAVYRGHEQGVSYATCSPNGKWIASVSRDGRVKVWAVDRNNQVSGVSGAAKRGVHEPGRDRIAIAPNGKYFAGLRADGTTVVMFDYSSGQERSLLPVGSTVNAITFSPNSDQLVVAHSGGIQVWDCSTGDLLRQHATASAVLTVATSPDGESLAIGLDSRQIAIVEFDSLEQQTLLPWKYLMHVRKVAFSPSGDSLAVVTAGPDKTLAKIHVWDTARWIVRFSIDVEGRTLTDLCFSHDGRMLAVSEGTTFQPNDGAATRLIDANTGKQVAMLRSGAAYHSSVAFPTIGNAVATATNTGIVTLWDLETYDERMTLEVTGGEATGGNWDPIVESMLFAPDGRTLVTSNARAEVWRWQTAGQARVDELEKAALLRRGGEYISGHRWQEAVDLFSHILRQGDDGHNVLWNRATALAELGRPDEAVPDFEELLSANSTNYRRWYESALTQLSVGDLAAYHDTCLRMLHKFRATKNLVEAEFVCWTTCLVPVLTMIGHRYWR